MAEEQAVSTTDFPPPGWIFDDQRGWCPPPDGEPQTYEERETKMTENKHFSSVDNAHKDGERIALRTRLVFAMVDRWGMVAGILDGEDSAGRSRLRLATPSELVDRAYDIADLMIARGETDGDFGDKPTPEDFGAFRAQAARAEREEAARLNEERGKVEYTY